MVHPGGPGRGDQGGRVRRRGRGEIDGRDGGPGRGRGGRGRGVKNQQQQRPSGKHAHPEGVRGPAEGCFCFQGDHYVREFPELTSDQKAHLFIQTQEGGGEGNSDDEDDYDVNVEYHDGVCGINVEEPPRDVEGIF